MAAWRSWSAENQAAVGGAPRSAPGPGRTISDILCASLEKEASMGLDFVGISLALSRSGFSAVAQSLNVQAAEIWAVLAVETSGCGFLADRRPQILYERHYFHRLTGGRFDDGDISDPKAGGYGPGGAHQYDRLARAIAKDRTAALQSTSWGLGQIMGENCAEAGFQDVETMVAAMSHSEDAQLAAVAAFLDATHLDAPLKAHDWASFAAGYNGPSYAKNHYDVRVPEVLVRRDAGPRPASGAALSHLWRLRSRPGGRGPGLPDPGRSHRLPEPAGTAGHRRGGRRGARGTGEARADLRSCEKIGSHAERSYRAVGASPTPTGCAQWACLLLAGGPRATGGVPEAPG